jgi:heme/copper-type cytochrome/quinol oxidase subunit 3
VKAVSFARVSDWRMTRRWIVVTIAAGLSFLILHLNEWRRLVREGLGPGTTVPGASDPSHAISSTFFGITGLHMLHVLSGIVFLAWLVLRRKREQVDVEIAGMYWQFVDAVWIFVFGLLYVPLMT